MWVTPASLHNLIPSTHSASPDRSSTSQRKGEFKNSLFLLLLFSISISSEDNSRIPRSSTAPRNNTQLISIKLLQHGLLTTSPKAFLTSLCFLPTFHSTPQHRDCDGNKMNDEKWKTKQQPTLVTPSLWPQQPASPLTGTIRAALIRAHANVPPCSAV